MLKKIRKIIALKYLEEQSSNAKKFITDRQENYSESYSRELFESYQSEANTLVEAVKIISTVVYTNDLVRIEEGVATLGEQSMIEDGIERMKLLEERRDNCSITEKEEKELIYLIWKYTNQSY